MNAFLLTEMPLMLMSVQCHCPVLLEKIERTHMSVCLQKWKEDEKMQKKEKEDDIERFMLSSWKADEILYESEQRRAHVHEKQKHKESTKMQAWQMMNESAVSLNIIGDRWWMTYTCFVCLSMHTETIS